jgi:hypothetical protein
MVYIENSFDPSQDQIDFINFVSSDGFPWYYQHSTDMKYMFYAHVAMSRDPDNIDGTGKINSSIYDNCYSLFKDFCEQNSIEHNTIYRTSLNSTYHIPDDMVDIHIDHHKEHKVFLLYLNEFTEGYTYIFDKDNNLIKTVYPQKFKGVVFSGEPHSHGFCSPFQRRLVLVVNFS